MTVFLSLPLLESAVPGLTLNAAHIPENICEGSPTAELIVDEYLLINVMYDGSNPFVGDKHREWQFIFVAPQINETLAIASKDYTTNFCCIPPRSHISKATIVEEAHVQRLGIWLRTDLVGGGSPYIAHHLIPYLHSG